MSTVKEISLSSDQRILVWQSTLKIFRDFPIIGTGLGTFASIFPAYRSEDIIKKVFSFAHNEYLQLLSEVGIVGFLIFFVGFAVFFFRTIKQLFRRHDRTAVALTSAGLAGLCAGFVHALVDFPFRVPANGLLLALILGVVTITGPGHFSRDGSITLRLKTVVIRKKGIFRGFLILSYIFLLGLAIRPALADYVARKDVLAAFRLEPQNGRFHYLVGQSYLDSPADSNLNQALPYFLGAVRLDPYNAKYRQSLGWLYANLGYLGLAKKELGLAVQLDPTNPARQKAYQDWFPGE
ncbi:MAG: O-antigen ligase family protein [Candidatus Omnitrophica bacterium]|nr:O-antigen ligase family protein [Candidatus Omnitrophota bacterium]